MRTWQKIMFAVIICMTWGMLTQSLIFWGGTLLGPPKEPNLIFFVCMLSSSVTIKISLWLELFSRFPGDLAIPIVLAIQFLVYALIAFAISMVIYKNDKAIKESDTPSEPTQS